VKKERKKERQKERKKERSGGTRKKSLTNSLDNLEVRKAVQWSDDRKGPNFANSN